MILNSLNSQNFELEELLVILDCVRWQRTYAQEESPDLELEEFVLFHRYLEHKIANYIEIYQRSGENW